MQYVWQGRKPHRRTTLQYTQGDKHKARQASGIEIQEILPGESFEPTPAELASFGDLMQPVGAGLRMAPASDTPEE